MRAHLGRGGAGYWPLPQRGGPSAAGPMGQGGGSPATPLTLPEACAPPHPGLKPHGRLVAAPRGDARVRPQSATCAPRPRWSWPLSACWRCPPPPPPPTSGQCPSHPRSPRAWSPVPIPARPRTQPFNQTGPQSHCGRTLRPDLCSCFSELRLHLPFPNPSLGPLPHPVSQPGGCQTPA